MESASARKSWRSIRAAPICRLGSFKVNRYNGRWADFATGDKGGDPISLVAYLADVSQGEAARLLARMLGVERGGDNERL